MHIKEFEDPLHWKNFLYMNCYVNTHTHTHTHVVISFFFQLIYSEIYLENQCRENNRILSNGQPSLMRNLKVQNVTDRILQHSPVKQN